MVISCYSQEDVWQNRWFTVKLRVPGLTVTLRGPPLNLPLVLLTASHRVQPGWPCPSPTPREHDLSQLRLGFHPSCPSPSPRLHPTSEQTLWNQPGPLLSRPRWVPTAGPCGSSLVTCPVGPYRHACNIAHSAGRSLSPDPFLFALPLLCLIHACPPQWHLVGVAPRWPCASCVSVSLPVPRGAPAGEGLAREQVLTTARIQSAATGLLTAPGLLQKAS